MKSSKFRREVFDIRIEKISSEGTLIHDSNELYCLYIQANSFLWHMIRCIMNILYIVGEELEEPTIVLDLLDIEKYPSRPQYDYATPDSLFLWKCTYDDIKLDSHASEKSIKKIMVSNINEKGNNESATFKINVLY